MAVQLEDSCASGRPLRMAVLAAHHVQDAGLEWYSLKCSHSTSLCAIVRGHLGIA